MPLNIAEGAGEYSSAEKGKFYRIAKRSATECAAIFDICRRLRLIEETRYTKGRELLMRIVAMLTKMAKRNLFRARARARVRARFFFLEQGW